MLNQRELVHTCGFAFIYFLTCCFLMYAKHVRILKVYTFRWFIKNEHIMYEFFIVLF